MINQQLSDKIKAISFLCTCMVVYRHAYTHEAFFGTISDKHHSIYNLIAFAFTNLTSIAVPIFFLISGFFFFNKSYYEGNNYFFMLKKKWHTLFIPFCIWNIMAIYPMWLGGKIMVEDHWYLYLFDFLHSDFNGPLWYVRTLMLLMLLSPLYDWIFFLENWGYKKIEVIVQTLLILYVFYVWCPMDSTTLSNEGCLFFLLGGILQKHSKYVRYKIPMAMALSLYLVWALSCFFQWTTYWTGKVFLLLGVVFFWQFLSYVPFKRLAKWSRYSFFIYVTHFISLKVMKTILAQFFYGSEFAAVATFLLLPVFVVLLTISIGKLWNKLNPQSFAFATGGRI